MEEKIKMKICTKCGNEYPATEKYFYRQKNGKLGLKAKCKSCEAQYTTKHRDEIKDKIICTTCGKEKIASNYNFYYIKTSNKFHTTCKTCLKRENQKVCFICGKLLPETKKYWYTMHNEKTWHECKKCANKKQREKNKQKFEIQKCEQCGEEYIKHYKYFAFIKKTNEYHTICERCMEKQNLTVCRDCGNILQTTKEHFHQRKGKFYNTCKECRRKNVLIQANGAKTCILCNKEKPKTRENFTFIQSKNKHNDICKKCLKKDNLVVCTDCGKTLKFNNINFPKEGNVLRGTCYKCRSKKSNGYRIRNIEAINNQKRIYSNGPAPASFIDKMTVDEMAKIGEDNKIIAKCKYCGKYFYPTVNQINNRHNALTGIVGGEHNLYCSDGCKSACPIFNQRKWPKGFKKASSREVDPLIRQMCLKRDDYTCQKCGKTIEEAELHSHHIEGATQMPLLANDVENTITLCKKCHKWVHKQSGCTYYDLRCK